MFRTALLTASKTFNHLAGAVCAAALLATMGCSNSSEKSAGDASKPAATKSASATGKTTTGTAGEKPAPAKPAAAPAGAVVKFPAGPAKPVTSEPWGKLPDGRQITLYTLDNGKGLRVKVADYGALLVSIETPDRTGKLADIALGYAKLADYFDDAGTKSGTYFGAVVGRVANRIAHGRFTLNGVTHDLFKNNDPAGIPCSLHGGKTGFDKQFWHAATPTGDNPTIVLVRTSHDGEENYPGNLSVVVTYTLLPDNTLRVEYSATTDKPTPVNISQHSYFNLAGEGNGTILNHELRLVASNITPVNPGLIPTGKLLPVKGTPFDFTTPHKIGERVDALDKDVEHQLEYGAGYDHNWVLDGASGGAPRLAAEVYEPTTGRVLTIKTTEPGIQFYCGNFLKGDITGKSGKKYIRRGGFALETQHFPDSPNQPAFPSIILKPGDTYKSVTEFTFSAR
ncbi:MAG: galactose mutarotase [Puniceicoccales bacterium]|jgi:aldose 1-epimerase|nr:galactose mutarotase [Puniceicoccales bacterium]